MLEPSSTSSRPGLHLQPPVFLTVHIPPSLAFPFKFNLSQIQTTLPKTLPSHPALMQTLLLQRCLRPPCNPRPLKPTFLCVRLTARDTNLIIIFHFWSSPYPLHWLVPPLLLVPTPYSLPVAISPPPHKLRTSYRSHLFPCGLSPGSVTIRRFCESMQFGRYAKTAHWI